MGVFAFIGYIVGFACVLLIPYEAMIRKWNFTWSLGVSLVLCVLSVSLGWYQDEKTCPYCKSKIPRKAIVCPKCTRDLPIQ